MTPPADVATLAGKWRERERKLCRTADAAQTAGNNTYARVLSARAEAVAECADELEAALRAEAAPPTSVADEPDAHLLAWAVSNCHTLARRRLAKVTAEDEWWRHVLRICEKAGARSAGVLRAAVPTEITDGAEAAPGPTLREQIEELPRLSVSASSRGHMLQTEWGEFIYRDHVLALLPPPPAPEE